MRDFVPVKERPRRGATDETAAELRAKHRAGREDPPPACPGCAPHPVHSGPCGELTRAAFGRPRHCPCDAWQQARKLAAAAQKAQMEQVRAEVESFRGWLFRGLDSAGTWKARSPSGRTFSAQTAQGLLHAVKVANGAIRRPEQGVLL